MDLTADLTRGASTRPWLGHGLFALGVLAFLAAGVAPTALWSGVAIAFVCFLAAALAYLAHSSANVVVLFIEPDSPAGRALEYLADGLDQVASCWGVWRLLENGGRTLARPIRGRPRHLRVNVDLPGLPIGRGTLWFLPDRLLFEDPHERTYVTLPYSLLDVAVRPARVVERGSLPRDTTVADTTYRHRRVDGGPDRRFSHNPVIPICEYDELTLTTPSGEIGRFHLTARGRATALERAIKHAKELAAIGSQQVEDAPEYDEAETAGGVPPPVPDEAARRLPARGKWAVGLAVGAVLLMGFGLAGITLAGSALYYRRAGVEGVVPKPAATEGIKSAAATADLSPASNASKAEDCGAAQPDDPVLREMMCARNLTALPAGFHDAGGELILAGDGSLAINYLSNGTTAAWLLRRKVGMTPDGKHAVFVVLDAVWVPVLEWGNSAECERKGRPEPATRAVGTVNRATGRITKVQAAWTANVATNRWEAAEADGLDCRFPIGD